MMNRRQFFSSSLMTVAGVGVAAWLEAPTSASAKQEMVTVIQFSDAGEKVGPAKVEKVRKTDAEWRQQLSPEQYDITRKAGTERPFSGEYDHLFEKGLYRCICCGNALYSSTTKFDSGTGWPSFWAPIAKENVREAIDDSLGMSRQAVSCTECEAHLGHVFTDGPKPTHLRYCMNSVALKFIKA